MAKKPQETAAPVEEVIQSFEELMASFSDSEKAELLESSGQAANSYDKIPTLKLNYSSLADVNGKTIKEGNWVINQNTSTVEVEVVDEDGDKQTELRVEDIGIDLGKNPKITIYTFGSMYSYYPQNRANANDKCKSQLVFDASIEKHAGDNLPYECRSGKCPRRQADIPKDDKCGCQWVIFCEVATPDGERIKALLFAKGSSYMPFADYVKSLGTKPIMFAPTKLSSKQEMSAQGKPYYVAGFTFMEKTPYPQLECKSNMDVAKQTRQQAQAQNSKHKTAIERKGSPGTQQAQLVDKSAGKFATDISTMSDEDDIQF